MLQLNFTGKNKETLFDFYNDINNELKSQKEDMPIHLVLSSDTVSLNIGEMHSDKNLIVDCGKEIIKGKPHTGLKVTTTILIIGIVGVGSYKLYKYIKNKRKE